MAGPTAFDPRAFEADAFQIEAAIGEVDVTFGFDASGGEGTVSGIVVSGGRARGGGRAPRRIEEDWRRRRKTREAEEEKQKPRRKPQRERPAAIAFAEAGFGAVAHATGRVSVAGRVAVTVEAEVAMTGWAEDEWWLILGTAA